MICIILQSHKIDTFFSYTGNSLLTELKRRINAYEIIITLFGFSFDINKLSVSEIRKATDELRKQYPENLFISLMYERNNFRNMDQQNQWKYCVSGRWYCIMYDFVLSCIKYLSGTLIQCSLYGKILFDNSRFNNSTILNFGAHLPTSLNNDEII